MFLYFEYSLILLVCLVPAFCCSNHEDKRAKDYSVDLCFWENGMLYIGFIPFLDLPCSCFNMLSTVRCVPELRVNIFQSWLRERYTSLIFFRILGTL